MQRVPPTRLYNLMFNRDIKLQRCLKMVIGEETFVQASMLMLHRTPNCEAAANQLHTIRQGSIVSGGKHKQIYKKEFILHLIIMKYYSYNQENVSKSGSCRLSLVVWCHRACYHILHSICRLFQYMRKKKSSTDVTCFLINFPHVILQNPKKETKKEKLQLQARSCQILHQAPHHSQPCTE